MTDNKERMNLRDLFLKILGCSLWGEAFDGQLSIKEFREVLSLAEEQTVFGLVLDALKDARVEGMEDKTPLFEAIGVMEQIKQQNRVVNAELAEFASLCEKNGLPYVVVKGQTVGSLYPEPLLRQSGDIDFLVHGEGCMVKGFAVALGVEIPKMKEMEVGFERYGISYELHTGLRGWAKKEHQEGWDDLIDKEWQDEHYVEIGGQKVRTLSPTVNAAYIFIHLFFHFIREGVSLRQMCDWTMVLHHYKEEIDRDKLMEILLDLGMFDAYCAFGTILVDKLGLPLRELPVPINDEDRKWQGKILDDVFKGGNFGKLNHGDGFKFQDSRFRSLWYKLETFGVALRNSFKYYRLCPSEVGGMIPRLVKGNLKIMLKR